MYAYISERCIATPMSHPLFDRGGGEAKRLTPSRNGSNAARVGMVGRHVCEVLVREGRGEERGAEGFYFAPFWNPIL